MNKINVTHPHNLPVEEAVARLSKGDKPSLTAWLSSLVATLKMKKVTVEYEVDVPGEDVPLTVVIGPDDVRVVSGEVWPITEKIGEQAIKAKLAEVFG